MWNKRMKNSKKKKYNNNKQKQNICTLNWQQQQNINKNKRRKNLSAQMVISKIMIVHARTLSSAKDHNRSCCEDFLCTIL